MTQDDEQTVQNLDVEFQAWIERNGQEDKDRSSKRIGSEFSKDIKKESTLNGLANAALPIVVGSCTINEETNSFDASYFTSAGPTFNKKNNNKIKKPELCAPGENIFSAEALTDGRFSYTGTSVAAPHVTGAIALIFQRAKLLSPNSNFLTITQIRNILINSPDPHTTGGELQHDYQLGFGRVNSRTDGRRRLRPWLPGSQRAGRSTARPTRQQRHEPAARSARTRVWWVSPVDCRAPGRGLHR